MISGDIYNFTYILLIEDDPAVAESLRDGLARAGFDVLWKAGPGQGSQFYVRLAISASSSALVSGEGATSSSSDSAAAQRL